MDMPSTFDPQRHAVVYLSHDKYTIVDKSNLDLALDCYVCAFSKKKYEYAVKWLNGEEKVLHRLVMERTLGRRLSISEKVHHVDGDLLNNTRENLKLASHTETMQNHRRHSNNKSGYKGVYYMADRRKWRAQIVVNKKRLRLGYFDNPKEAHDAYCEAAKKYFGEFAKFE